MRILMVCMQHDYGDPARGYSYEYWNFAQSLQNMGHEVLWFDYMAQMKAMGRDAMNAALVEAARSSRPDLAIFSLYTDQLSEAAVDQVRQFTKTFCFFHDDTWRVDFSRHWAAHFDYFSSSDFDAIHKYRQLGLPNVVHMPFGINQHLYHPIENRSPEFDVSFVGGWHPVRAWLIQRLQKAGFKVAVFGHRWPGGMVSQEEMVRIFNVSAINLNLSNSTTWDMRYLFSSPKAFAMHFKTQKVVEQIKARHFEINACNAFQLSYYVEGLERCYTIGEEIAVFNSPDELISKVDFYLSKPELRQQMAQAGYSRTMQDHTYAQRFNLLFQRMGIAA
ncbi:MAG TPA: glycosyltransferase [Limnobacter sp.]|nr:glycosyltransferase [Limnobacter sp.]